MTPPEYLLVLTLGVLAVAFLYSSVGHGGASGYIAVMTLIGLMPDTIKPTALILNILVASLGTWQFWRAGHFSWPMFWPFALASVPCAFIGGYLNIPAELFRLLVGLVLLYSAGYLLLRPAQDLVLSRPHTLVAVGIGGGIGLLSGLTGTGGGIFLTPLLLFRHWAGAKQAAAVSAPLILVNSVAGLTGHLSGDGSIPTIALFAAIAAGLGGFAGSYLGSRRFDSVIIKRALALVLLIAGLKLVLAGAG